MIPKMVNETWLAYWRNRMSPAAIARVRLHHIVATDREAAPAWRWVKTAGYTIDEVWPFAMRKPRYRLERRR